MHCPSYTNVRKDLVEIFRELDVNFNIQNILYENEHITSEQNEELVLAVHSFFSFKVNCLRNRKLFRGVDKFVFLLYVNLLRVIVIF